MPRPTDLFEAIRELEAAGTGNRVAVDVAIVNISVSKLRALASLTSSSVDDITAFQVNTLGPLLLLQFLTPLLQKSKEPR